jgi:hypothetical protein
MLSLVVLKKTLGFKKLTFSAKVFYHFFKELKLQATVRIQIVLVRTNYHYFPSPPITVKQMGKTQHQDAHTLYKTVRLLNKSGTISEYLDAVSHFTAS